MEKKQNEPLIKGKKNKTFSLRVNESLYTEAETLYAKMGLPISTAINIFLQQSINVGGLPFELKDSLKADVKREAMKQLKKEIEQGLESGVKR